MKSFALTHTVISVIDLPCDSPLEARDYINANKLDIMSQAHAHTFVTFEGGIDEEDIEELLK